MFVCHGNICRSPMAEFVFTDILKKRGLPEGKITVSSCATSTEEIGNDIHPGTRRILEKYGIKFARRSAVQLERSDYEKYDLFVGMDTANVRNMHRIFGSDPKEKITKLLDFTTTPRDVADPWYTGDFELTYRDILRGCEALYSYLKNEKKRFEN